MDTAQKAVDDFYKWSKTSTAFGNESCFEGLQKELRCDAAMEQAVLTNFRMMRTTSSHMSNYSHWRADNAFTRCGLRLGPVNRSAARLSAFRRSLSVHGASEWFSIQQLQLLAT